MVRKDMKCFQLIKNSIQYITGFYDELSLKISKDVQHT